jgi:putative ferrous iron transport protein C
VILSDLSAYLQARGQATLTELALHLRAHPEAVREMLAVWERKGRVRRLPAPSGCGGACTRCGPGAAEVYQWVKDGAALLEVPVVSGCLR